MKIVQFRRSPLFVALGCLLVFFTLYFATNSHRNETVENVDVAQSSDVDAARLADLEWRVRRAVAQSNDRSKDLVDLRRLVAPIIDRSRGGGGDGQRAVMTWGKTASSKDGRKNVTAGLIAGMDHVTNANSLKPALCVSKDRQGVSLAIGIPTIRRDVHEYLHDTLQSLFTAMSSDEKQDAVVILMIAELSQDYCKEEIAKIESKFSTEVNSGLLEIIVPPASYYPDMKSLSLTFGDPLERVQWRTKQNLDYAFLMTYAYKKAVYYLQVEDDVISTPGFPSSVMAFAQQQSASNPSWILLEFSALGFIGKLFRSDDIPKLTSFFLMFHKDKPIDWLLDHFLFVKVCHPEQDMKMCGKEKAKVRVRYKPSLFQHIGQHSSLKGKIQKLKDKDFKKNPLPPPFINPPARLSTSTEAYQHHTLDQVYLGKDFFWATTPKKDDHISFDFENPVTLTKVVIYSGSNDHPGDICTDVTVKGHRSGDSSKHVMPVEDDKAAPVTLCEFDSKGIAECSVDKSVGPLSRVVLTFLSEAKAWVIIRQVNFHWKR